MTINISGFTIDTQKRANEDSFDWKVLNDDLLIVAIADGVGGNAGGSIASAIATEFTIKTLEQSPDCEFIKIYDQITNRLQQTSIENPVLSDMATTLTICVISRKTVRFAHVGDTRIYHLRSNGIIQKTKDQTEVALLVDQGILSQRKARKYSRRSVLVSALSPHGDYDLTQGTFELEKFDRIVMLTDGAYNVLSKKEVRDKSVSANEINTLTKTLRDELINKVPTDDATVILIEQF